MKITKIKRLVSFGNHENISLEADIEYGETVEECSAALLHQIKSLILGDEKMVRALNSYDWYTEKVDSMRADVEALELKRAQIHEWLAKFNIPIDAFNESEIPF